jgi:Alpha-glutamyl/putrescinyl thymine pyrophosphorylase clade 3
MSRRSRAPAKRRMKGKTTPMPKSLWPSRRYPNDAAQLLTKLASYERAKGSLKGIAKPERREAFVCQLIESIRRVRYVAVMSERSIGAACGDPSTDSFDPLKAAILSIRAGDIDEACWHAFLFVHFGKHSKAGWRLARDFYAGGGPQTRWTWALVRKNPRKVTTWLATQRLKWAKDGVARHFGNHRKFESLKETGKAIESYVEWVGAPGHSKLIANAVADAGPDRRAVFDHLYKSMASVWGFGRTAKFDYLALLGKLNLAPIDPASAYLVGATGPLDGTKQLFGKAVKKLRAHDLDEKLLELGDALGVNQQVLEDAICNWQKSPASFRPFRG